MKPVYLEFCGVNSFSEKTEIDFSALISGGVFGIFGDTGSGKSTLLDCIHLALYGRTERSGNSGDYINYKSDGAYVTFDFEITTDGKRHAYRVHRERRRKNNTTKAALYEYEENGKMQALAEGTRDVDDALENIIGLTFADFKMCIALPQGDFAALVQAPAGDRVKLVSRLFDLEKYGERFSKAANEKYYAAEREVNLVKAKMEQYEDGETTVEGKEAEIKAAKEAFALAEKAASEAEQEFRAATEKQKAKEEYEGLSAKLQNLTARLPEMQALQEKIEKIPFAKAVVKDSDGLENNRLETQRAKEKAERAEKDLAAAESALSQRKEKQTAENYDERILQATVNRDKVKGAAADIQAEKEAEKLYLDSVAEYRKLQKQCPADDFDGKIKALEKELASLGEDESLLDYLKRNLKGALTQDVCGEVRADLRDLAKKHPTASEDIERLLVKYTPSKTAEENLDIAQMNVAFKQLEQKKKSVREKIEEIKKNKEAFEFNERQKAFIIEQGKAYRAALDAARSKTAEIHALGELSDLEESLRVLQNEKLTLQRNIELATEKVNGLRAEKDTQRALFQQGEQKEESLIVELQKSLAENGFKTADEAKALLRGITDTERAKTDCKSFFDEYSLTKHKYEQTDKTRFADFDEAVLTRTRVRKDESAAARDELRKQIAYAEAEYDQLLEKRKKYAAFEKELKEKEKEQKLCDELRSLLARNRFLEFIASEYLQEICAAASKTLLSLTSGRYFLQYDKEFKVGDNLDGGNLRAVKTLSGGETFLVSLSLALSLSAAICLKSLRPIEFFFLDEGFGTLDEKLVDTVMDVLAKLSKNFAVGLISHVEELKHRIDNKILVTGANEQHGSLVKMERF
ncbi:MAG: SMC family ATPase [Clostridia bacterium]|nr:SMC family ATPase [Clostridia bacterium]